MKYGVRGTEELKRNLEKLGDRVGDALEGATRAGALIVQNDAKDRAPYKTGNLMRSIHMETTKKTNTIVVVEVGSDLIYAAPQEFGTSTGVPAHPYLRPAIDENADEVKKEIKEALADILAGGLVRVA